MCWIGSVFFICIIRVSIMSISHFCDANMVWESQGTFVFDKTFGFVCLCLRQLTTTHFDKYYNLDIRM